MGFAVTAIGFGEERRPIHLDTALHMHRLSLALTYPLYSDHHDLKLKRISYVLLTTRFEVENFFVAVSDFDHE